MTDGKDIKHSVYAAIQQPAPLQQDGFLATNWQEWKAAFNYFICASGKDSVPPKEKCALFMHCIGKYGRELYEELDILASEKDDYSVLCKKFEEYCNPSKNINFERHIFFETYQNTDNFDKYLGTLKSKSKNCDFGSIRDSLILTQVIRGISDAKMREKLLAKSFLTLEEAVQWCRAAERAGEQAGCVTNRASTSGGGASVEQLWRAEGARSGGGAGAPRGQRRPRGGWRARRHQQSGAGSRSASDTACGKCGFGHSASDRCPAYSVKCYRCDRVGHFAKCCRVKYTREVFNDDESEDEGEIQDNGELLMYNISIDASNDCRDSWCANIDVNGVDIKFKLDSGAEASVMSLRSYEAAGFDVKKLNKSNTVLREISKKRLPLVGCFYALLKYNSKVSLQTMYVLDVNCSNLLGLKACVNLNILARADRLSIKNIDIDESIFSGIGCLPKECEIQIDESIPPVVNATRKIPIKLRPRIKNELDNMEKLNIIKKEDGPTDWVSSIVVVEKPNKSLRICLDPKNLNRAIKRSHFQLPTLDEIASNLTGAKYFSKCDAKNGFWMVKLTDKSSKLCTFSTPYGRYRFLRMPFGINCAPEIFHQEMYKIFKMEGIEIYIDDVLVWGKTKEEHDERLKEVLRRAKENGVKFNKEKCLFGVTEITFLGHTFNNSGMRPNESRVKAILDMPKPKDKSELQRFLGVTNYLSRFIPRYSEISSPLRMLMGRNVEFDWLQTHDNAYSALKKIISSAPVLKFYSPNEPVTLSVDASSHGLGACLLQGGRPVAYAARTLTPTETRWAQIEKELLAVVFGCTRFHQYVYGHEKITVESDHKPLEAIFKKNLNETPARLQRLMLKLQHYHVQLQYKPGKLLFIADTLSRAAVEQGKESDISEDITVHVNMLYENVEASPEMLRKLQEETGKDTVLKALSEKYKKGWPNNKRETEEIIRSYWNVRNELHLIQGVMFKNEQVVIPLTMREEMLRRIHEGHLGVEKCQRRAREVMWWSGMSAEIERAVLGCATCQRHRAANPREPLAPHPLPSLPWEVIAADVFEFKGNQYLLVVDYYSKFVEIAQMKNLLSSTAITIFKELFSRYGIPKKVVTDNATQFTSQEFKSFSKSWEFVHETSSPLYPRSNGLAERNVRTVKALLVKAQESGEEWQLALLNFRNTPLTGEQYSPAQLLMSRRLNTKLPAGMQMLRPEAVDERTMRQTRTRRTQKYKENYDRGTRELPPLKPNDSVHMRNKELWIKSRVVGKARGDRSYWVETDNGGLYRRNRQHILNLPNHQQTIKNNNTRIKTTHVDWEHVNGSTPIQLQVTSPPRGAGSNPNQYLGTRPPVGQISQPGPVITRSGRVVRSPIRFVNQ